MPLNDGAAKYPNPSPNLFPELDHKTDGEEFEHELQDEYGFDAHYPPGTEIGAGADEGVQEVDEDQPPLTMQWDYGSGSYAEDGRLEVAEDRTMANGEAQIGSYAMFGPTEIGAPSATGVDVEDGYGVDSHLQHQYEIGSHYPEEGAAEIGSYAMFGPTEIGNGGYIAKYGQSEIGTHYPTEGAAEIGAGHYPIDGGSEIGNGGYIAKYGPSEIGAGYAHDDGEAQIGAANEVISPFEGFMLSPTRIGTGWSPTEGEGGFVGSSWAPTEGEGGFVGSSWAPTEGEGGFVGGAGHYPTEGASEIVGAVIARVIEKARDNRQPCPPMKAVSVDTPEQDDDDYGLTDVVVGAAKLKKVKTPPPKSKLLDSNFVTGDGGIDLGADVDPFPLTTKLLLRAGAAMEPRIVRVDTEASYKAFRTESSPSSPS